MKTGTCAALFLILIAIALPCAADDPPKPSDPKKCIGRVKYFSRNRMVRISNRTRKVRLMP